MYNLPSAILKYSTSRSLFWSVKVSMSNMYVQTDGNIMFKSEFFYRHGTIYSGM